MFSRIKRYQVVTVFGLSLVASLIAGCGGATASTAAPTQAPAAASTQAPAAATAPATPTTSTATNAHIKDVTAITEVFGDGQKLTAVAVEYNKEIDHSKLSKSAFSVSDRTITNVYANTAPAKTSQGINGKYVIIELSTADANAATFTGGKGPGTPPSIQAAKISVTQVGDVTTADGRTELTKSLSSGKKWVSPDNHFNARESPTK